MIEALKYDEKRSESISRFIDAFCTEFKERENLSKMEILRHASKHTPSIEGYSPEISDEMKGRSRRLRQAAQGADHDLSARGE